uniref:Putative secreted protein n=1 Tax=Ixodes ricinus TaxID=34613 RepID=A0A6B0U6Y5_IXORI
MLWQKAISSILFSTICFVCTFGLQELAIDVRQNSNIANMSRNLQKHGHTLKKRVPTEKLKLSARMLVSVTTLPFEVICLMLSFFGLINRDNLLWVS